MSMKTRPVCLFIMDGYGINESKDGNAVIISGSPNVNSYIKNYPSSQLGASGRDVGLPDGQMGNSEVGHLRTAIFILIPSLITQLTAL